MPATKRLRAVDQTNTSAPAPSDPLPAAAPRPGADSVWSAAATAIAGSLVTFSLLVAFIFAAFVDSGAADLLQGPALVALGIWLGVRASGRRAPHL
jgi:hypothetical protein